MLKGVVSAIACAVFSIPLTAQVPGSETNQGVQPGTAATFQVNVVARNIKAVNYRHRAGSTTVDFRGTDLMPRAKGEAKVDSKTGRTTIDAKFDGLGSPNQFGMEYLTYVLWAITPEGRAKNLGEVVPKDEKGALRVTSDLQAFGMIVTAEPHFAVVQPSDVVVLENLVRPETKGVEVPVTARYELLPRGLYGATNEPIQDIVYGVDKKAPLYLLEARNAVRIARTAQAERYASSSFDKAQSLLRQAETYYKQKQDKSSISTVAREAAQTAEEARVMALNREQQERAENERRALAEREAQAKARAEAEAAQHAQAEQARRDAESAAQRAAQERERAEQAKATALAQQQAAQAQAEQARLAAQQAQQARVQADQEKEQMRARLLQQLNDVLQTRDTARGLIVNMSDVLFDTGKATLKPGARANAWREWPESSKPIPICACRSRGTPTMSEETATTRSCRRSVPLPCATISSAKACLPEMLAPADLASLNRWPRMPAPRGGNSTAV